MGVRVSKSDICIFCSKNNEIKNDHLVDSKNEIQKLSKIQANYRGYIYRKKNPKYKKYSINVLNIKDKSKLVKEIPINYNTKQLDNNKMIKRLYNLVNKFELNEKEKYMLNTTSDLKTIGLLYPNNIIYKGTINKKNQKEGYGKLYMQDGSIYEGFFKENKMEGRGRLYSINGYVYDGEFKNNYSIGYGKCISLDGTIYKGNWYNSQPNGLGEEKYNDNSYYIGKFKNGKKAWKRKIIYKRRKLL